MRAKFLRLGAALMAWTIVVSCGGGTGGGSDASGGATGGTGSEVFSCTLSDGSLCTQLIVQSTTTALNAEKAQCTNLQGGTSGKGCATTGIVGCCLPKATDASKNEQCVYTAAEASIVMGLCTNKGQTWSATM